MASTLHRLPAAALCSLFAVFCVTGCALRQGQRYDQLQTPTPLPPENHLILGFLGGREPWDNEKDWVRKLALKLRAEKLPGVHVETLENRKRHLALQLIRDAFDHNRDGALDDAERRGVRLILYGHSFGGAAVVKLARQLHALDIPVLLTVQIDSVGRHDARIPPNVRRAANLYQTEGWFIRGEAPIRAEDARKTEIIGNFRHTSEGGPIDLSETNWFKRLFRVAHTKMGHDPEVWRHVEQLIRDSLELPASEKQRGQTRRLAPAKRGTSFHLSGQTGMSVRGRLMTAAPPC